MSKFVSLLLILLMLLTASSSLLVFAEGGMDLPSLEDILNQGAAAPSLYYTPSTETVFARKFVTAPKIDGNVSTAEWGIATLVNVQDKGNVEGDEGRFPSTFANRVNSSSRSGEIKEGALSFTAWLRWDADNLYVALITEDKSPFNSWIKTEPDAMWRGDSLQISVNTAGNWAMQRGVDTVSYEVSPTYNKGVFAVDNKASCGFESLCGVYRNADPALTNAVVKNDGTKTTYEIAIAWEAFHDEKVDVKTGDIVGMALGLVSGSAEKINNYLTWGDMHLGFPSGGETTVTASQRVGDNKVVLSDYDINSTEKEPAFPKYSVKFYSEISGEKEELFSYLSEPQDYLREPDVPDVDGNSFLYWEGNYDANSREPITHDVELTAVYNRLFKVVFRKEKDGKVLLSRKVAAGTKLDPPTNRVDKGFVKWSTDEYKNVQKDLDIYAIYGTANSNNTDNNDNNDSDDSDGSMTLIIIIAIAAVVVIGGGVTAVLMIKKKKSA